MARANAIELVKYLIQTTGIPADYVIRHYDAKGKYCPRKMMDSPVLWEDFKKQIGKQGASINPAQEAVTGIVTTEKDPLRLREVPDGKPIKKIPKGASVSVLEQGSDWHKVYYDGETGYAAARYITMKGKDGGYVGKCTGDGVRVRSTPEFGNDNILRKLNKGNLFSVLSIDGVWTHIDVEGMKGYIYSEYVARV